MFSLQEVLHVERKLYLVFEYLDQDLKKYMDVNGTGGLPPNIAKVQYVRHISVNIKHGLLSEPVIPAAQWDSILPCSQSVA